MSGRRGTVWYGQARVGSLREDDGGRLQLSYDGEWAHKGFAVSVSLPISAGGHEIDAHTFFAGLLPEGASRRRICRQLRIREADDVGLLLAIGRDCAGAFTVVPGEQPPQPDEPSAPISEEDFALLVESHGQAMLDSSERQRFSLAGAQDKVALFANGDALWLPAHDRPSTHIFKFETIKRVCFAEYAAHEMARRIGLQVPPTRYHEFGDPPPTPYLRIERYDRAHDAQGKLVRLHQEDFTQAMGYSNEAKYQVDGGPSLAQVAELVRNVSDNPIRDIAQLRDWQLFNYLIGNSDGHAKNIALLYSHQSTVPRLAPAYDLVAIEFLNRLGMRFNRKMAFYIGEHDVPEQVSRKDWLALAKAIHVPGKLLLGRLRTMAQQLPDVARDTRAGLAAQFGDNQAYNKLEESVADRCGWVLREVFRDKG